MPRGAQDVTSSPNSPSGSLILLPQPCFPPCPSKAFAVGCRKTLPHCAADSERSMSLPITDPFPKQEMGQVGTQRMPTLAASCDPPTLACRAHTRSVCARISAPAVLLGRKAHGVTGGKICLAAILERSQPPCAGCALAQQFPKQTASTASLTETKGARASPCLSRNPPCTSAGTRAMLFATGPSGQLTNSHPERTGSLASLPSYSFIPCS